MKFFKDFAVLVFVLSFTGWPGQQVLSASSPDGYTRYLKPGEINEWLTATSQKFPGQTKLITLCTTPGGNEIKLLEIGTEIGKAKNNPAVLVVANFEGNVPISSLGALYLADLVLEKKDAYANLTWYIVPDGDPDALLRYFSKPLYMDSRNILPHNDDLDELTDEDGFNDLDGNGIITQMRVKDPAGEWMVVEGDPRTMRLADNTKGEKGVYKLYTEGLDDDGDGQYNEDGLGGTNPGINFSHLFHSGTESGGLWPGSTPETYYLMKFVFEHPEIAMTFSFGSTDFCSAPPRGGRRGSANFNEIKIPERFARMFNADPEKTYTMKEIMEMVKPMLPEGMEVNESMIASFLGLGAVVNPLEDDLKFYTELSDKYKEYLKANGVEAKRLEPEPDKDGSFELWAYYQLGVPSFAMNLFTLPEPQEAKKESSGITIESLEKMSAEEFTALEPEKIGLFLKESGAPPQYKPEMLINMVKSGQMPPAQIAAMIKKMPKPADTKEGDPRTKALLSFSDAKLGGKGFVDWKPYKHPTLGEVEIGGAVPYVDNTPPESMIDSLLRIQVPWALELTGKLPHLAILDTKITSRGAGIYELEVWIENKGYLPFPTAMGEKNAQPAPAVIILEGTDFSLLSGKKRTSINKIAGDKNEKLSWLIQAEKPVDLTLNLRTKAAWNDQKTIKIGGEK